MGGLELETVQNAFASNWIAPVGPDITAFERMVCEYTGAPGAVALASGTAAIHLALLLCGVGEGYDVYCSSFTFAGSAFPIIYVGATPVFIDSEACSWNMDPELLRTAIRDRLRAGRRPGAILVVHLYGQSANMASIRSIADEFGIPLIEDAAESLGAFCGGVHTGTLGEFGIFSFNGNKIITTSGGGMLVGTDQAKLEKARNLSTQARDALPWYEHSTVGYNYRMSNVVAAIGCGQIAVLEERVAGKQAIYEFYRERFDSLDGIELIPRDVYGRGNCWLTCIVVDPEKVSVSPEEIRLALEAENIESRPLWKPMHLQPVFGASQSYTSGISGELFKRGLCLPSGTAMNDDDRERVVSVVRRCLGK